MKRAVHFCSFSALDDLPKKLHRDEVAVCRALVAAGRFSIFEVCDPKAPRLSSAVSDLIDRGRITTTRATFPWTNVELTDAGREWLRATQTRENS